MTVCKELTEVLTYENKDVVLRFTQLLDFSEQEAELIFEQTLKWLWLCAQVQIDRENQVANTPEELVIDKPLSIIDEMWHNFICFTYDYEQFCNTYLGRFIHHFPMPANSNGAIENEMDQKKRRQIQYGYIYDKLGPETLTLWYDVFPDTYSPAFILEHRIE